MKSKCRWRSSKEAEMLKGALMGFAIFLFVGVSWGAENFRVGRLHAEFMDDFNNRNWTALRNVLADDIVFHRANGKEVFIGRDAVIDRFSGTIGAPDQWNVKFAILDSDSQFEGKDGRVVERGDFAVTAGEDGASCYRGSYMMTWAKTADGSWKLQMLAWQDVETDLASCEKK